MMRPLDLAQVNRFVSEHIGEFHQARITSLEKLQLKKLLRNKNPYLFRAKNLLKAQDLIENLLSAHISSSEEELFGQFLERLAIFIAGETCGGIKSNRVGLDLEFRYQGVYYIVQIKSGEKWGNSSQHKKLAQDFQNALVSLPQEGITEPIQPILGICYGKAKTVGWREVGLKIVGQNFWYLISQNERLYLDIITPLGHEAARHNEAFEGERARISNQFTQEFMQNFCDDGLINWEKLVAFNSGNFDLSQFYEE